MKFDSLNVINNLRARGNTGVFSFGNCIFRDTFLRVEINSEMFDNKVGGNEKFCAQNIYRILNSSSSLLFIISRNTFNNNAIIGHY